MIIHHIIPIKKSFPLPLTKLETNAPSIAATFKLIRVRTTRNTLWLINSLSSLLFHPGMQILRSRNKFLKNSLFSSTFCRFAASPYPNVVDPRCRAVACLIAAAFCSAIAERIRLRSAKKRVRYTVREILVRCLRYRVVSSEIMLLIVRSGGKSLSFDCAAIVACQRKLSRALRMECGENAGKLLLLASPRCAGFCRLHGDDSVTI
jgi:hypothetical protein